MTERADGIVKRAKPSSETPQKSSSEDGTNEIKPNAPIPEAKSPQVKQSVKQVTTPTLQKSAAVTVYQKPAFIGKLPCLQTSRAKKANRAIGTPKALASRAVSSTSSTAGGSGTNVCTTKKIPGNITADLASTARLKAAQRSSDTDSTLTSLGSDLPWLSNRGKQSDSACSKEPVSLDTSSMRELESPAESSYTLESCMAMTDSDTIEETMLGDFEIFDECDAD